MTNSARALWLTGREHVEIRAESLPVPGEGSVLVDTHFSGVSRGTELLVFSGRVPPTEYERMRAPHQAGQFPWPVKFGYANVGRVRAGSSALVGRDVFCLYPHQTAYVADESAVVLVPSVVPPERAVLAANMETAVNAVWDAELKAGDRVAVVGAGVVGLLVAYLAGRVPGAEVESIDIEPSKATAARVLGVTFVSPADARGDADVVIHATGAPAGLVTALSLAGREATVVELSWFGDHDVEVPLGRAFHARRLRLQSSQVGNLPASQRARWTLRRRLELALSLLDDPVLDVLVSSEGTFDELPGSMSRIASSPTLCHRVRYR